MQDAPPLERAASALAGSLRVRGGAEVSGVMADVMRLLGGVDASAGVDHLTVADRIAPALGLTPLDDGRPPGRADLARFGLFIDSAVRLGLSPGQTERVSREVRETPDRQLTDDTRAALLDAAVAAGRSREAAEREITRLQTAARLLPDEIIAWGALPAPAADDTPLDRALRADAALAGSAALLGGTP